MTTKTDESTALMPQRWRERAGATVHPTSVAIRPHGLLARGAAAASVPAGNPRLRDNAVSPLSIDEWDILFRAVSDRLALSVANGEAATTSAAEGLRDIMLAGVEALDQLHAMLVMERARHQRKIELFDAQMALAEALTGYGRSTSDAPTIVDGSRSPDVPSTRSSSLQRIGF